MRIRRREKIIKSTEFDSNDSDLEANLERAEFIGTQLDPLNTENVVEELTVENRVEEGTSLELQQKPEFPKSNNF